MVFKKDKMRDRRKLASSRRFAKPDRLITGVGSIPMSLAGGSPASVYPRHFNLVGDAELVQWQYDLLVTSRPRFDSWLRLLNIGF